MNTIEFLQSWAGHPYDAILQIVQTLSESDKEPWAIIKDILSYPETIGATDVSPVGLSNDIIAKYAYHYRQYLIDIINVLSFDNPNTDDFYKGIYQQLFETDILHNDVYIQATCLYILHKDIPLVPYTQAINPFNPNDEDFKALLEKIQPQIQLAKYMKLRLFDTKTEEVSQYWEIANALNTREEQIVFWLAVLVHETQALKKDEKDN